MIQFFRFVISIAFYFSVSDSYGALLNITESKNELEKIKIAESAELKDGEKTYKLKLISSGLREKKVAFISVNVYVAQWFIDSNKEWNKNIDKLTDLSPLAMRLTFKRNLKAAQMKEAFMEALKENKVNLESEHIKKFLDIIQKNGDINENTSLTLVSVAQENDKVKFLIESTKGTQNEFTGPSSINRDIFSIWFGESSDKKLLELKNKLLGS